jgi:tryptophan-rich sensory protein
MDVSKHKSDDLDFIIQTSQKDISSQAFIQSHDLINNNNLISQNDSISDIEPMFYQRINGIDFLLVYAAIVLITILFLIVSIVGASTTWHRELRQDPINPWIIRISWLIATALSYVGLFLLWKTFSKEKEISSTGSSYEASNFLAITVLFLISTFLSLGWAAIFYYSQNIGLSLWLVGILFVYKFWLFMYIWYIKPIAALFLIPLLIMYIYLMYSVAHLAYLNNILL